MITQIRVLVAICVLLVASMQAPASGVDSMIVMEAEAGAFVAPAGQAHSWIPVLAAGYANSGAIQALPNTGTNHKTEGAILSSSPRADYLVNISTAGIYTVWVYGISQGGADNSVHIGANETAPSALEGAQLPRDTIGWGKCPNTLNLAEGIQTVNLWMREDGAIIDRILLTTSTSYTPPGVGPAESDTTLSGSSPEVNQPPSLTFVTPSADAVFAEGDSINVEVQATDSDGLVNRVELTANGADMGTQSSAPYGWTLAGLTPGNYTLIATAFDDDGDSSAVSISVSIVASSDERSITVTLMQGGVPIANQVIDVVNDGGGSATVMTNASGVATVTGLSLTDDSLFDIMVSGGG